MPRDYSALPTVSVLRPVKFSWLLSVSDAVWAVLGGWLILWGRLWRVPRLP